MSNGFVYLIRGDREGTFTYKIGKSNSPNFRIKSIQTSNPDNLEILYLYEIDIPYKLETFLHRTFSPFSIRGEWFKSDKIEDNFLLECNKFKKMIEIISQNTTLSKNQLNKII